MTYKTLLWPLLGLDGRSERLPMIKPVGHVHIALMANPQSLLAYMYIYLPTPPPGQDVTQGQFLKRSLTGLNSEFSFS